MLLHSTRVSQKAAPWEDKQWVSGLKPYSISMEKSWDCLLLPVLFQTLWKPIIPCLCHSLPKVFQLVFPRLKASWKKLDSAPPDGRTLGVAKSKQHDPPFPKRFWGTHMEPSRWILWGLHIRAKFLRNLNMSIASVSPPGTCLSQLDQLSMKGPILNGQVSQLPHKDSWQKATGPQV